VVGGIYSPQPPKKPLGRLLSMGAPDSPVRHRTGHVHCLVRCHVTQPLGFGAQSTVGALSSCGIGQSGAPSDLLLRLLRCTVVALFTFAESTVARVSRCSAGAPDSPVNCSRVRLLKGESGWFNPVRAWCTRHCPVAPRTIRCARPQDTWFLLLL
jgi:hypothetical protein